MASTYYVAKSIQEWNAKNIFGFALGTFFIYYLPSISPPESSTAPWFIFLAGALAICAMILPTAYFPCILQFALVVQAEGYQLEVHEHFVKQSYRNRCEIYGANGKQKLVIPVKWRNHSPMHEVKLSYAENWQKLQLKSLESAYRASPFFDYYEEDLKPYFQHQEIETLLDWNRQLEASLFELLMLPIELDETTSYEKTAPDFRDLISPKNKPLIQSIDFPPYLQVFGDRHGFIPNLSILDVLFNLGPESVPYLKQLKLNPSKWQKR
jgi:hypothetical protein